MSHDVDLGTRDSQARSKERRVERGSQQWETSEARCIQRERPIRARLAEIEWREFRTKRFARNATIGKSSREQHAWRTQDAHYGSGYAADSGRNVLGARQRAPRTHRGCAFFVILKIKSVGCRRRLDVFSQRQDRLEWSESLIRENPGKTTLRSRAADSAHDTPRQNDACRATRYSSRRTEAEPRRYFHASV